MKKILALTLIMGLLLTGCVSEAALERARLQMEEAKAERDEARAEADEAHWRAEEANAETEREKAHWDGVATMIAIMQAGGMPYFFGSLLILICFLVFMACAFPDKIFANRKGGKDADERS